MIFLKSLPATALALAMSASIAAPVNIPPPSAPSNFPLPAPWNLLPSGEPAKTSKTPTKKQQPPQNLKKLKKLAEDGDANSQYKLGQAYLEGDGAQQNFGEAITLFRKSAEQKNADAHFSIGLMYDEGNGVPQDYVTAAEWYTKAAELGHATAQYSLGLMHTTGQGLPNDLIYAHMWFNMASANGHAEAIKGRKWCEARMTQWQLGEAQALAREFLAKNPLAVHIK
jgi:TPR repeat protein